MQATSHSIIIAVLLIFSPLLLADKLYKYQDQDGVWQYTDRKPVANSNVEEIRIQTSNEKAFFKEVWIRENTGDNPRLTVVNNYHGPIEAHLTVECKKCKATPNKVTLVVAADSEQVGVQVTPTSPTWSATYKLSINLGDPAAQHNDNAVYGLPVPMDKYFLITQGFNGKFSHTDDYNRYAIDILMDIGTPVLAARSGIVMAIEQGFKKAGVDEDYADKANVVYILHEDGSIALYAHLDMFAALVKPGQRIERGDVIARSGNTGFSTGPHLHFNVQKNIGGGERSIPYQFDKGQGKSFVPVAGQEVMWDIYSNVTTRISEKHQNLYAASMAEKNKKQDKTVNDVDFGLFWQKVKTFVNEKLPKNAE